MLYSSSTPTASFVLESKPRSSTFSFCAFRVFTVAITACPETAFDFLYFMIVCVPHPTCLQSHTLLLLCYFLRSFNSAFLQGFSVRSLRDAFLVPRQFQVHLIVLFYANFIYLQTLFSARLSGILWCTAETPASFFVQLFAVVFLLSIITTCALNFRPLDPSILPKFTSYFFLQLYQRVPRIHKSSYQTIFLRRIDGSTRCRSQRCINFNRNSSRPRSTTTR